MARIDNINTSLSLSEGQSVVIDSDVTVTGSDIAGGRLVVSGLLAEDRVTIASGGPITVSGTELRYNGTAIGRIEGGTGSTFTVFLNANATATNVEAAVERLTFTSVSQNPTESRALAVTLSSPTSFGPQTTDPFSGIDIGDLAAPSIVDLTGDGRQDLVVAGDPGRGLYEYRLYMQQADGSYVRATGSADPFATLNSTSNVATDYDSSAVGPAFIDLVGDSRPEMVVGYISRGSGFAIFTHDSNGQYVRYTATDPLAATAAPRNAYFFRGEFVDYDGDGDLDLVTGYTNDQVRSFTNDGGTFVASTTFLPQIDLDASGGDFIDPAVFDVDGDGDLDLVVSVSDDSNVPSVRRTDLYLNAGDGVNFTRSSSSPFAQVAGLGSPTFGDINNDGRLDFVIGQENGTLRVQLNTSTGSTSRITANVASVNDAPVIGNVTGDSVAYTRNANPVRLDASGNGTVADLDSADFDGGSLVVTITNAQTGDRLNYLLPNPFSITGRGDDKYDLNYNGTTIGTIDKAPGTTLTFQFNANATPEIVGQALRTVAFQSSSSVAGTRSITWTLNDGDGTANGGVSTATATSSVAYTVPNTAPTNTAAGSVTVAEDSGPVALTGFSVADGDVDDVLTVTLTATRGTIQLATTDGLTFTNGTNGKDGVPDATLSFSGSHAALGAALNTVTFTQDPDFNGAATVGIGTSDGIATSTPATTTISITPVADITPIQAVTVNEDSGATRIPVDLSGFEGTITNVGVTARAGTSVTYSDNGTANRTDDFFSFTPDANYSGDGGFTYVVSSGGVTESATVAVTVTSVNDAPTIANLQGNAPSYTENSATPTPLDAGQDAIVADVDNANFNGGSLTVTITNAMTGDQIGVGARGGIATTEDRVTYNGLDFASVNSVGSERAFAFNANATHEAVQSLIRVLEYSNQSAQSGSDRQIQFVLADGAGASTTNTTSVMFINVDDAPTLAGGGNTVAYTENGSGITVNPDLALDDADNPTLSGATVRITSGLVAGDQLTVADRNGITGSYTGDGVLTLSGTATVAQYQAALRGVTFSSSSENPGPGSRTVSFAVSDGQAGSNTIASTVTVAPLNDAPTVTASANLAATERVALSLKGTASIADVDAGTGTLRTTLSVDYGILDATAGDSGVTIVSGSGTGALVIDGTLAQTNAFLGSAGTGTLTYTADTDAPPATTTLVISVDDNGNTGGDALTGTGSSTITITNVNDPPTALADTAATDEDVQVGQTTRAGGLLANDTDPDTGDAAALVVASARAGAGAEVTVAATGTTAIAGTYGTLALAADGTYRYTPDNAQAQALAAGEPASESFTYTVRDPGGATSSATLTIAITGVNDAPTLSGDGAVALRQGGSVVLTTADLTASDVDGPEDGLSYTVTATSRGQVEVGGRVVDTFTQAQLEDGDVTFRQDSSGNAAASFTVTVSDGLASSAPKTVTAAVDLIPTITGIAYGANDGTLRAGERVELIVRLSESVTVTGTPTLALSSGGTAGFVSGSGSDTLVFAYTVAAGESTPDLAVTGLSLDGGTIRDGGGQTPALPAGGVNPAGVLAVDTAVPGAPTIRLVNDTGASSGDGVTFDPGFAVTPAEAGGTLLYRVDGAGALSADRPVFATDGSDDGLRTVTVVQQDAAGNRSAEASLSFTLDTLAPSVEIEGVTGATNVVGHTIVGGAEAGGLVTIANGGAAFGSATAGANGAFELPFVFEGDGPRVGYAFTASQTDLAGNVGSDSFDFALDFTPNRPLFGEVVTDPGSVEGQVYALFDGLLGRAPDASGWGSFVATFEAGVPLAELAQGILTSPEFTARFGSVSGLSDEAFVDELYQIALGRGPDALGEQAWLDALASGTSRAQVALGFAFSAENQGQIAPAFQAGVYVPDPIETDVARLYYGLFDRAPDAGGQQNWSGNARAGLSLEAVAQAFLTSAEYGALHPGGLSDEAYVASLYEGALGRMPDAQGRQDWLDALAGGASRAEVAVGIADSAEANAHLSGRIEAGWHLS